ncbi:hypothetical protein OMAG_002136, partial [Candidatus Omnitrophus magneticus]
SDELFYTQKIINYFVWHILNDKDPEKNLNSFRAPTTNHNEISQVKSFAGISNKLVNFLENTQ